VPRMNRITQQLQLSTSGIKCFARDMRLLV